MAATFLEPEELAEENLQEDEQLASFDDTDSFEEQPVEEEQQVQAEDEVPERYRGKSTAEIIQMHKEAEKLLGKHGQEVGELRKIVDDFVKSNLDNKQAHSQSVEEDIDLFDDPKAYVRKEIESNPDLAEVKKLNSELKQQNFMNKLNTEFPEHVDLVNNQEFVDWVSGSNVRQNLYRRAANEFDWESAEELLSTWRKISNVTTQVKETQKADTKNQRKAASTGSANSTGEQRSRKIYRRSDIINLMRTDPERYSQLADEILQAYSEGRVRS